MSTPVQFSETLRSIQFHTFRPVVPCDAYLCPKYVYIYETLEDENYLSLQPDLFRMLI